MLIHQPVCVGCKLTLWGSGWPRNGKSGTVLDWIGAYVCIYAASFFLSNNIFNVVACVNVLVSSLMRTTNSHYIVQPSAVQGQSINLDPLLNLGHACNFHCY